MAACVSIARQMRMTCIRCESEGDAASCVLMNSCTREHQLECTIKTKTCTFRGYTYDMEMACRARSPHEGLSLSLAGRSTRNPRLLRKFLNGKPKAPSHPPYDALSWPDIDGVCRKTVTFVRTFDLHIRPNHLHFSNIPVLACLDRSYLPRETAAKIGNGGGT